MNQIEEDVGTDQELSQNIKPEEPQKKSELTRPEYNFKGATLFPFSGAYQILFNQARDREDTGLTTWMIFVFLLSQRNGESPKDHRKWAMRVAWKMDDFKDAWLDWADEMGPFSDADMMEAKRIYEEIMQTIKDSLVEPIPSIGSRVSQKKMSQKKNI